MTALAKSYKHFCRDISWCRSALFAPLRYFEESRKKQNKTMWSDQYRHLTTCAGLSFKHCGHVPMGAGADSHPQSTIPLKQVGSVLLHCLWCCLPLPLPSPVQGRYRLSWMVTAALQVILVWYNWLFSPNCPSCAPLPAVTNYDAPPPCMSLGTLEGLNLALPTPSLKICSRHFLGSHMIPPYEKHWAKILGDANAQNHRMRKLEGASWARKGSRKICEIAKELWAYCSQFMSDCKNFAAHSHI